MEEDKGLLASFKEKMDPLSNIIDKIDSLRKDLEIEKLINHYCFMLIYPFCVIIGFTSLFLY